jgi:purine-nucleoside phosphorylase
VIGPGDTFPEEGAALLRERVSADPAVSLILGSGLADAVSEMDVEAETPFTSLPGFPSPSVPGHPGTVAMGWLGGVATVAFLGRLHFYEGHSMSVVTLPVRLSAALGVRTVLVTGAVGGVGPTLEPGMVVVGTDHINFLGVNPLRGWKDEHGYPAFVDLTEPYDPGLVEHALSVAKGQGLKVSRGVYAAMPGPTYETATEVAFLRSAGATVVGMSVVPEVVAAAALGLRCVAMLCVTNRVGARVSHEEVTERAAGFAGDLARVFSLLLPLL